MRARWNLVAFAAAAALVTIGLPAPGAVAASLGTATVSDTGPGTATTVSPSSIVGAPGDMFYVVNNSTGQDPGYLQNGTGTVRMLGTPCTAVGDCILPLGGGMSIFTIETRGTFKVSSGQGTETTFAVAESGGGGSEPVTTYTLTYDGNGGVCRGNSGPIEAGSWVNLLPASACARSGYELSGFTTNGGGTYRPGQSVQVIGPNTLVAQWVLRGVPTLFGGGLAQLGTNPIQVGSSVEASLSTGVISSLTNLQTQNLLLGVMNFGTPTLLNGPLNGPLASLDTSPIHFLMDTTSPTLTAGPATLSTTSLTFDLTNASLTLSSLTTCTSFQSSGTLQFGASLGRGTIDMGQLSSASWSLSGNGLVHFDNQMTFDNPTTFTLPGGVFSLSENEPSVLFQALITGSQDPSGNVNFQQLLSQNSAIELSGPAARAKAAKGLTYTVLATFPAGVSEQSPGKVAIPADTPPGPAVLLTGTALDDGSLSVAALPITIAPASGVRTVHVQFPFNKATLDETAKGQLRKLAAATPIGATVSSVALGLRDGRSGASGKKLALARATAVAKYLASLGIMTDFGTLKVKKSLPDEASSRRVNATILYRTP